MNKHRDGFHEIWRQTRLTLKVGAPIVAAQLVQMAMGVVDTIMAGRLSARDLAAVGVGGSLYAPLLLFVMGLLMGVNPVVAQLHGAGERERIGRKVWQVLWLGLGAAIPVFFMYRNMSIVFVSVGISDDLIPVAQGYLNALACGLPAAFGYFALRFFHEGLTISKPSMYFAVVGLFVNILANWVFMYGHWGFPALGAVGTGWATALVQWVMFGGMLVFTFRRKNERRFHIYQGFDRPRWQFQRHILHVGLANGLSICIEVSMFATVALIMGSIGTKTVAAHQVTINFAAFTFMIPLGLSFATTARVGFAIGRNDLAQARMIGFIGAALSFAVMTCTAAMMISQPEMIARFYTEDRDVLNIAAGLIVLAGAFQISDGLQVAGFGALRGLKDTKVPVIVNVISYWLIGLPCGYLLGMHFGLGARGLWLGLTAGLSVAAILHNYRFHKLTHAFGNKRFSTRRNTERATEKTA